MKVLSIEEMNTVSGAYTWDSWTDIFGNIAEAAATAVLAGSMGAAFGGYMGGKHGGDGGGLLGVGSIGQGVGLIAGMLLGGIGMAVAGTIVGYDATWKIVQQTFDGILSGTWVP